jgi:uncharacterized protein (DUF302 family)
VSGLQRRVSSRDFAGTVACLQEEIELRGIQIFARIDHAANAAEAGLAMPPTVVLIFGNARGGTPAMLQAPSLAYELPLRLLIRQDGDRVLVEYRMSEDLADSYGVPAELIGPLRVISDIAGACG